MENIKQYIRNVPDFPKPGITFYDVTTLFAHPTGPLYVPCQASDQVVVLDRDNLSPVAIVTVPGAHGVFQSHDGSYLYTTNLPGAGSQALVALDTSTNTLVSEDGVDAPSDGKPHNIVLSGAGDKLYLTHSGPEATTVSVFSLASSAVPVFLTALQAESNPFGLAFVD